MQDAITNVLNKYDTTGKYLDRTGIEEIQEYLDTGIERLKIVEIIARNSSKIVKETATRLYLEEPELLRPGGNSYTTRRYATCLRDIDYYLRYTSYSIISGSNNILNERLLDGLKETYLSLSVPIGPIIKSIQILKSIIINEMENENVSANRQKMFTKPLEHISISLSEQNI